MSDVYAMVEARGFTKASDVEKPIPSIERPQRFSQKEGMPEESINVLCIDGGGVRGLSSLLLLREVMGRIGELEGIYNGPKPSDHFNVIAGTGSGAVSACMLGRLCMPVDQAIQAYIRLFSEVYSDKGSFGKSLPGKGTRLRAALKALVSNVSKSQDEPMVARHTEGQLCKTMVFAMSKHNLNANIPVVFRSYQSLVNPAPDCTIWEALYASMAHPDLFGSIEIQDGALRQSFVGGELGCSNPLDHVLAEVRRIYPDHHVSCVLSIGAGHARTISLSNPSLSQRLLNIERTVAMKQVATDSERIAEQMAARFQDTKGMYYRFNVDQGMQDLEVGDWEKLSEVGAHTRAYIGKVGLNREIDLAAQAIRERKCAIPVKRLDGRIQESLDHVARIKHCPAPSSAFTGREDQIQGIATCITDSFNERRVCVVHGLGGAGKTQLALKTIERHRNCWTDVFYIDSSSKEILEITLQDIAHARNIGKTHEDTLIWLESCRDPWLLVYDSVDDPGLDIHNYFPCGNRGSILIVTRLTDMTVHARGPSSDCRISSMSHDDALALLMRLARFQLPSVSPSEVQSADALLEDFGCFALAVASAGTYIGHSSMPISKYRELFLARRLLLLERRSSQMVNADNYKLSVSAAWSLCYELLDKSGSSRPLLWLIAYMHHNRITPDLFERAAADLQSYQLAFPPTKLEETARNYLREYLSRFLDKDNQWDLLLFSDAISELKSYCLIDFDPANMAYNIHVLVQEWARTIIPQSADLALECTTALLAHAVNSNDDITAHRTRLDLSLHVTNVVSKQPSTISANHAIAFSYVSATKGLWGLTEILNMRVKEAAEATLGAGHPDILASMHNLAVVYIRQGLWHKAEDLLHIAFTGYLEILGEQHPSTLASMGSLAAIYFHQGRWKDAEKLGVQALDAHRLILGEEHPETLKRMAGLVLVYMRLGRWNEAAELGLKTLDTSKRVLGEEHPDTLLSVHNLADLKEKQGQFDEAEDLLLRALRLRGEVLGKEHPDTLMSMQNLAATYGVRGRLDEAEELLVEALDALQRVLGPEHPNTLAAMHGLASTYLRQGRLEEAEKLGLKVLDAQRRAQGNEHPDVLMSMYGLGITYGHQHRFDKAEALLAQVAEVRLRLFGSQHPEAITARESLASLRDFRSRVEAPLDEAHHLRSQNE